MKTSANHIKQVCIFKKLIRKKNPIQESIFNWIAVMTCFFLILVEICYSVTVFITLYFDGFGQKGSDLTIIFLNLQNCHHSFSPPAPLHPFFSIKWKTPVSGLFIQYEHLHILTYAILAIVHLKETVVSSSFQALKIKH